REERDRLNEELRQLRTQTEADAADRERMAGLERELQSAREEIARLQAERQQFEEKFRREVEEVRQDLTASWSERDRLRGKVGEFSEQLDRIPGLEKDLEAVRAEAARHQAEHHETRAASQRRAEETDRELTDARSRHEQLSGELGQVRAQLESAAADRD